jgi:hypothetical protein
MSEKVLILKRYFYQTMRLLTEENRGPEFLLMKFQNIDTYLGLQYVPGDFAVFTANWAAKARL